MCHRRCAQGRGQNTERVSELAPTHASLEQRSTGVAVAQRRPGEAFCDNMWPVRPQHI